ncbi:DODA-type extradiol aromatic ring-opening family dioxygenase [Spartinivicinus poritis]|uniref:Class III extradiol ring-cleavage dioxygenase n=1 Tax=Spartinivicinus poritis TaxID=2994640 RepID=A0ABT5UED2_9GAMM|nr:class III extradiol ring-cleavage dioxygenase [Spartinivicinus sp. A2-2]MDE1463454.1 class III extradiol ring-cleavage dioxygenase [Spartinivicinus sp. A2-2]
MKSRSNLPLSSVLFISHGGGPLPLLKDKGHQELVKNLSHISSIIEKPLAILVISAHWEEANPIVTSGESPSLIYDYYGFPEESYHIQYPASGNPPLAQKIASLLKNNGIEAKLDNDRGFDHGLFIPLKIMYPEADIPCIQLSLVNSLDPKKHIQIGKALAELRRDNVLIIGSGFSFHNLKAFFGKFSDEEQEKNAAFENWLIETCVSQDLTEDQREKRLIEWHSAPAASYCHPREEHLLPLHVCYGLAQSAVKQVFTFNISKIKTSCYLW